MGLFPRWERFSCGPHTPPLPFLVLAGIGPKLGPAFPGCPWEVERGYGTAVILQEGSRVWPAHTAKSPSGASAEVSHGQIRHKSITLMAQLLGPKMSTSVTPGGVLIHSRRFLVHAHPTHPSHAPAPEVWVIQLPV